MTDVRALLAAPFDEGELKCFPVVTTQDKKRGKPAFYVDARAIQNRLDDVVGVDGWSTAFEIKDPESKAVECRLSVRIGEAWITKADVGYPNKAEDANDPEKEPYKAAYSDAFRRSAVHYGIARYLYSAEAEQEWYDLVDVGRRQVFKDPPKLRGLSVPRRAPASRPSATAPAQEPPVTIPVAVDPKYKNADGGINLGAFVSEARRKGLTPADVVDYCEIGGRSFSGVALALWLEAHPGQTLDGLIVAVRARKVAA